MAKVSNTSLLRMRLGLALAVALGFVLVLESAPALRDMIQPLQRFTAALASIAIRATGLPVALDDILLTHSDGFRVAISYGCTPLVPIIFLASVLTIGLSLSWRQRVAALITGFVLISILNLFRVTVLYYTGVVSPWIYVIAHEWLGQAVIVLGTAVVACYWINASVAIKPQVPAP